MIERMTSKNHADINRFHMKLFNASNRKKTVEACGVMNISPLNYRNQVFQQRIEFR